MNATVPRLSSSSGVCFKLRTLAKFGRICGGQVNQQQIGARPPRRQPTADLSVLPVKGEQLPALCGKPCPDRRRNAAGLGCVVGWQFASRAGSQEVSGPGRRSNQRLGLVTCSSNDCSRLRRFPVPRRCSTVGPCSRSRSRGPSRRVRRPAARDWSQCSRRRRLTR